MTYYTRIPEVQYIIYDIIFGSVTSVPLFRVSIKTNERTIYYDILCDICFDEMNIIYDIIHINFII